ncbi:MAG: J domain-containing protein [Thermoplasmata archaeon]
MTEYQEKNDIPDLYQILGLTIDVCNEPDCTERIHQAYVKKAKMCHPDKHPGRKDMEELFELITEAYNILADEKQRNAYNHKLSLNKQCCGDFTKLKKSSKDYVETIGQYKDPTEQQKLSFKEKMKELDIKHGYDATMTSSLTLLDARKKMEEMAKVRAIQDFELKPEKLFEDEKFDLKKFNAAFDMVHSKKDVIVEKKEIPLAWDDLKALSNYSSIDKLDNLYIEDTSLPELKYAGTDFEAPSKKITKNDLESIGGADYVDQHHIREESYYRDIKSKLQERQMETKAFEKMKYSDFKKDDTAGYGIFDKIDFKIEDQIMLENNNASKNFERLMAERQDQNTLPPGTYRPKPPEATKKKKTNQTWK